MGLDTALAVEQEHTIGDKAYTFGPITLSDLARCVRLIRQERLNIVLAALPNEAKDERWRAMRELPDTMTQETLDTELRSPEMVARMLWIAHRKINPDATLTEWEDRVTIANAAECANITNQLTGADKLGGPVKNEVTGTEAQATGSAPS